MFSEGLATINGLAFVVTSF